MSYGSILWILGPYSDIGAPTKVPLRDPCPFGLAEFLILTHMAALETDTDCAKPFDDRVYVHT